MRAAGSKIVATSYRVPENRLTHQEMRTRFGDEAADKIAASSGIMERRVVSPDTCASDLAYAAAEDLLNRHSVDRSSIDLVVFASQTPDYLLPTTACLLQHRLRVPTTSAAFDINLGCSQYVYSVGVAHSMIVAGVARRALVLTGDTVSRIIHPKDRAVVPLFGDAGTATLMEAAAEGEGFLDFEFGSDGSGAKYLVWPTSGMRTPRTAASAAEKTDDTGAVRREDDMFMDGSAIFLFTLKTVPAVVSRLLTRNGVSVSDVDLFVFHQASELIVKSSAKKLGIPNERLHYKLHDVGNSGGSTVGIALTDAWLAGRVQPGKLVVLAAFGVGLSWAVALVRWPQDGMLGPVCEVDFTGGPDKPASQTAG